jgi:glutamate/aspartate transport system substrate-binding protein
MNISSPTGQAIVVAALSLAAAHEACAEDTLARIRESGVVTMGVRESSGALSYLIGANGEYAGFQVDLCRRILENVRQQIPSHQLEVKYQSVTALNRVPLLVNGTIDIECGSTANTQARQRDVDFSFTTFVEETRIAVKAASGIASLAQLSGKRVVTTAGTTSVQSLRRVVRSQGLSFDETFGKDHADSFLLLESDRADAFVMDGQVLAGLIANSKSPSDYRIVGESLAVEPVAIMVRKDSPAFKKIVNETLSGMFSSGEAKSLYEKWFMRPIPPSQKALNLPLGTATKAAWESPNQHSVEEYAKGQ